ncbi:MAG TPA: hypothetical protein VIQ02_14920 [Jiangellaceae bacterium]|jgi:hypothetical protein
MTARLYQITVNGLIGPILTGDLPGFTTSVVNRHHVLMVPADAEDRLLAILGRLHEHGIDVERVTARYRE